MIRNITHGFLALIFLVAAVATPVIAQEALTPEQLRAEPGYVEFGDVWQW